jgi:hypothetical protein
MLVYEAFVTCPNGRSMTDQTLGLPGGGPRTGRLRSLAVELLRWIELAATTSWAIAGLIFLTLTRYFWREEGSLPNILFTAGVTLALIAFLVVLSRRVLLTTLVALLIMLIAAISSVKRAVMNMVMHAYDIVFYLSSWSTIGYLWNDQRRYLLALAGALLGIAGAAWLAHRVDGVLAQTTVLFHSDHGGALALRLQV